MSDALNVPINNYLPQLSYQVVIRIPSWITTLGTRCKVTIVSDAPSAPSNHGKRRKSAKSKAASVSEEDVDIRNETGGVENDTARVFSISVAATGLPFCKIYNISMCYNIPSAKVRYLLVIAFTKTKEKCLSGLLS